MTKITNMSNLFSYQTKFNENINDLDVSNVINMTGMFNNCDIFATFFFNFIILELIHFNVNF